MRVPIFVVLALAVSLPLAACSSGDLDYLTCFGSAPSDDEDVVAEAPQAASQPASAPRQVASGQPATASAQTPAMDPWCSQVMSADVAMAQRNGLDQATQQRMAVTSYRQCLAIFAGATPTAN